MSEFKLISDYKNIDEYRASFNQLATDVFGIDFEPWYKRGFWNDRYICYSYIEDGKVVSNISVSKMDIIWERERKNAIQIGTVMTHPEYRKKGLAASLMNTVMEEYENKCDFIYLFANKSVLDFYPKFGFKPLDEYQFSADINILKSDFGNIRRLNISDENDLNTILRLAADRRPISSLLGVKNDQFLLMFYCMYVFTDDIYYLEQEDSIAIFKQEGEVLHLYDLIGGKELDINDVLRRIASCDTKKVIFHFTPDYKGLNVTCSVFNPHDKLFMKPVLENVSGEFVFPATSHA